MTHAVPTRRSADRADGREQRRHVAAAHPLAAARVEDGLQLLHHEGHVAAAAEHRADHPGQRHGPGVVLHVLRVDEHLEGPPDLRSEEHTSELQSLMPFSYAVFCWTKKTTQH